MSLISTASVLSCLGVTLRKLADTGPWAILAGSACRLRRLHLNEACMVMLSMMAEDSYAIHVL